MGNGQIPMPGRHGISQPSGVPDASADDRGPDSPSGRRRSGAIPGFLRLPILSALGRDSRGVIVVMIALMLPVIFGFVGLGIEVSNWYMIKRSIQNSADAGALAGAYEIFEGNSTSVMDTSAENEAERDGYFDTASGDSITVNNPPSSGSYTSDNTAVEVELEKTAALMFASFFISDPVTIKARAVAGVVIGDETACVLALSGGVRNSISASGGGSITMSGCSLAANSDNDPSISATGGATITADCFYTPGGYSESGGGALNVNACSGPKTSRVIGDPYADIDEPTADACDADHTDYRLNTGGSATIDPGTWCGGIDVTAGSTLTMNPGLYILDEGHFSFSGVSSIIATGVTIVLMDSDGTNCGDIDFTGGASVDMSAMTTGTYAGFLFFRHSDCSSTGGNHIFAGGSSADIVGIMYFPSKEILFSGGTAVSGSCLQIVADTVNFTGSGTIGNDCDGTGVPDLNVYNRIMLVE